MGPQAQTRPLLTSPLAQSSFHPYPIRICPLVSARIHGEELAGSGFACLRNDKGVRGLADRGHQGEREGNMARHVRWSVWVGRLGRRTVGLLAVLGFSVGATVALASAAGNHNLTSIGDVAELNDGAIIQQSFLAVVGTGNLNPFLRVQDRPVEDGYNTSHRLNGTPKIVYEGGAATDDDTDKSTHDLLLNTVPIVSYEGGLYREFRLDLNEDQSDGNLVSLDAVGVWVGTRGFINAFDPVNGDFDYYGAWNDQTVDGHGQATEVWQMDDGWWVTINSSLSAGSGNLGDARLLVPAGDFGEAGEACPYNPTASCDYHVYFYTEFGADSAAEATFEEWSVRDVPYITKTVETSLTRTYPWTIEKTVSPEEHHLFDGDSDTSTYQVTVTKGAPVDSDWTVSGTITITNPGDEVDILSVDDAIDAGGGGTIDAVVVCPGVFPVTLDTGDTLVCTYSAAAGGSAVSNPFGASNTATFTYDLDGNTDAGAVIEDVDFTDATVTEVDGTVDVEDVFDGGLADVLGTAVSSSTTFTSYDRTFDCSDVTFGEGATTSDTVSYSNTASVKSGAVVLDSDSETVAVTCYRPTISKDASTRYIRTFDWTIEKSVTPDSHDLFDGDTADSTYTVSVVKDSGTDSGHEITGSITIGNPHPTDAMTIGDLTDVLTGDLTGVSIGGCGGTGVTYVGGELTVPAGGTAVCTYSASVPGKDATLNTASFTLFGKSYSDDVAVTWGDPAVLVNDTVDVEDVFDGGLADVLGTAVSSSTTFTSYDRTFDCSDVTFGEGATTSDTVSYSNTASVKSGAVVLDDDSETVDVRCYRLGVDKTAVTTYTRDHDWSISKGRFIAPGEVDGDGDPSTLTLMPGQTYLASYQVVVTMTGYTDTDHTVSGVITVTNPAPIAAEGVVVTDQLSLSGPVVVDCDPETAGDQNTVDIPAGGSVECTYSTGVTDDKQQLNTVTATLFAIDYTGTADVVFGDPTVVLDDCVTVTDDAGTPGDTGDDKPLGTVCLGDLTEGSTTLTYTMQIGPYAECGEYQFVNTASFVTSDQDGEDDDTGSASYTVNVTVPCPQGCTLTQGYWRTHSIYGPAPYDNTWALVGEDTVFFLSEQSWYQVMWTSPQGGNAYYILAHQYIAAVLNGLNGADTSQVDDELSDAAALFEVYTPQEVSDLKGKTGKELRGEFITLAGVLGSYNEGTLDGGPPHCDEDGSSVILTLGIPALGLGLTRRGRHVRRRR